MLNLDTANYDKLMEGINNAIDGHNFNDIIPALCWYLAEIGVEMEEQPKDYVRKVGGCILDAFKCMSASDDEMVH